MAILITNDGDKVVATIAERNAITKKFDGMKVTVNDAIADVLVGGGQAGYEWSESQNKWLLTFKTTTDNLTFITESKVVASGKATATNFPQDGIVWDCFVLDSNNIVVAEFSAPVVNGNEIQLGSNTYDGQTLKFTYGYGAIQAAVNLALAGSSSGAKGDKGDKGDTGAQGIQGIQGEKGDAGTPFDASVVYTKTETDSRIQDVIGGIAPSTLDTISELAAQMQADESAASALVITVGTKVDKVVGKQLSTEDYSTAEKTKLADIEAGAQVNPTFKTINSQDITGTGDIAISGSGVSTQALSITTDAPFLPPFFRIPPRDIEVNGVIQAAQPTDKWIDSAAWYTFKITTLTFNDLKGVGGTFAPTTMAALTTLSLPVLANVGGTFAPATMAALTTLSLPVLTNVGGSFNPAAMAALTTLSLPALTNVGGTFAPGTMAALTTLSLPALTNVGGTFAPGTMAALTAISFGAIERIGTTITTGNVFSLVTATGAITTLTIPNTLKQIGNGGGNVVLTSCALNQTSVDNLLIRLAALNGTNGTTAFSNRTVTITGTSSAPSATGLAAKATLVARGCTVTHI
jgi:hypothetical protein